VDRLGGWDERNLTEDADMGIRISVMQEKVRVVYDDRYVTKEETPPTLNHFIRQRTRWNQGFLQTLKKGDWLELPTLEQKLLALYTLAFPFFQSLLGLYVPVSFWMMFNVKVPVVLAIILLLPMYFLLAHYVISVVGLYEFAEAHGLKPSWVFPAKMLISYMPYQWVLGFAAVRATGMAKPAAMPSTMPTAAISRTCARWTRRTVRPVAPRLLNAAMILRRRSM